MELRDNKDRCFTKMEDLEKIYFYVYKNFYQYKELLEDALREVLEGLPTTFMEAKLYFLRQTLSPPLQTMGGVKSGWGQPSHEIFAPARDIFEPG